MKNNGKLITKVSNFRKGELMKQVRNKEKEGWEVVSKMQTEVMREVNKHYFIMEKEEQK